jgi:hypothetical protein
MAEVLCDSGDCGNSNVVIEFEPKLKVACVRWTGDVSLQTLRREYEKFRTLPEVAGLKAVIVDFSHAQQVQLSCNDISAFSQDSAIFLPGFPRVFIGPKDLQFGLLRMYQTLAGDPRDGTCVVRTMDEAYAALGLTEPAFQPPVQL